MRLKAALVSEPGTRTVNEDSVILREEGNCLLLVVADGLGGHEKGEIASRHVCGYIEKNFNFEAPPVEELGRVIGGAQKSLLELQKNEKTVNAMKTTVVVLTVRGDRAYFAHVGDSRGYLFDKRRKYIRTLDHSVPQMLVLTGEIREKEIRYHAERSSLLRVLGSPWEKDVFEISSGMEIRNGISFLLCSDGFWELVDEKDMMRCLKKSDTPEEWLGRMTEIIRRNGEGKEMDNYTAGAVFVREE